MSEVVLMMLLGGGINQVDFTMSSGNRGLVPIAAKYGEQPIHLCVVILSPQKTEYAFWLRFF